MYLWIDLKSFYASCECALRDLDPFTTPLVVADISRGEGSIVLAVSPYLKKFDVKSRCRILELPKELRKDIIYAKPRMQKYLEYSWQIYEIFLSFWAKEDIYVYSIDEAFINIDPYLKLYQKDANELAEDVLNEILIKTKLHASCGIGDNLFLAKIALDILGKKQKSSIAYLSQELFYKQIWDYKPLSDIWSIGHALEKRLAKLGLFTLRDVANCQKEKLEQELGIIGLEIYDHANGLDDATIEDIRNYKPKNRSINHSQVLYENYEYKDIIIIIIEMIDELVLELIEKNYRAKTFSLYVVYEDGTTFGKDQSLDYHTNQYSVISDLFKEIYLKYMPENPVKKIGLRASNFINNDYGQISIFENPFSEKEKVLAKTINEIKKRFGSDVINKAISNLEKATQRKRNKLIGGHNKE